MTIFFAIYLIGVMIAFIVTLYILAADTGSITFGDLLLCFIMSLLSWIIVLVHIFESINWDIIIWERKKKEGKDDGRKKENNSKTTD